MKNRLELNHTVGINVDSSEWHMLTSRMVNFSSYYLTGDYKKYGDKLACDVVYKCFMLMIDWYKYFGDTSEENMITRKVMYYELAFAKHLYHKYVYQCLTGCPSGGALTIIINSLVNMFYVRLAYINITRNTIYRGLKEFTNNVLMYSNGDDLWIAVKEEVIEIFNNESLQFFFSLHKIEYTDSNKSSLIRPFVHLNDVEYLKRSISKHSTFNIYVGMLPENSIYNCTNWVFSSPDLVAASLEGLKASVENAYTRGREFYECYVRRVRDVLAKHDLYYSIPSWSDMDFVLFSDYYPEYVGPKVVLKWLPN